MSARKPKQLNYRLRAAREQHGWSLAYVADQVGTDRYTVGRWERGVQRPGPNFRPKLCELFQMDAYALGLAEEKVPDETSKTQETPQTVRWSVPFDPNPYCTGLERLVVEVRERLTADHGGMSLLTISGLGGMGKTQLAIAYAHQYHKEYNETVFWVRADSSERLSASLEHLARPLNVPESQKRQPKPGYLVNEVLQWLREHDNWLLILDNVEEGVQLDFLPTIGSRGHVLLTTRVQSIADRGEHLAMEKMSVEVSALLLLRVIHHTSAPLETFSVAEREEASGLAHILDGLPLALVQAGAYMREKGRSLAEYRRAYQHYRKLFLRWCSTHEMQYTNYSESVATTWLITFQQIRRQSVPAIALLYLCAYLHPDAIPRDMILKGRYDKESRLQPLARDEMQLDDACGILIKYAFLHSSAANGMLSLHRLVQAVLKDRMSEEQQHRWAERAVRAVEYAWSHSPEADAEHYLPHAYTCAVHISDLKITGEAAASLLERAASVADERGWYTKAASLYRRAYGAAVDLRGENDPQALRLFLDVAREQMKQGQYLMAAHAYRNGYESCVRVFGSEHPITLSCLNNLALAELRRGNVVETMKTVSLVFEVLERTSQQNPVESARVFMIVGEMEQRAGHDGPAEECYRMALYVRQREFGPKHQAVAESLFSLGLLALDSDSLPPERLKRAEIWIKEALDIDREVLGEEHAETALCVLYLGECAWLRDDLAQAELLCRQAMTCFRRKLGVADVITGQATHMVARVLREQMRYDEAEQLFMEAKSIFLRAGGPESELYLLLLRDYADLLHATGQEDEAGDYEDYVKTTEQRIQREGRRRSFELPSLDEEGMPGHLFFIPRPDWRGPRDD